MSETLIKALDVYKFETLVSMAAYNGINLPAKRSKPQIIALLENTFVQEEHIKKNLPLLGPAGREVIHFLLRQGGKASQFAIQRWLESNKFVNPLPERSVYSSLSQNPSYRSPQSRNLEEILANLTAHGLIFGLPGLDPYGQYNLLGFNLAQDYFIPENMLRFYPAPPALPQWQPKFIDAPLQVIESSARIFQRDLYLYWSYVERNPTEMIAKGLVAKRHIVAINSILLHKETISSGQGESDFLRLLFLRLLLTELGILKPSEQILTALPAGNFLGLSPAERIQRCFEAYLSNHELNELLWFLRINANSYETPTVPAPDALLQARRKVVGFLKPAVKWMKIDSIIKKIELEQYEFLLPRGFRQQRAYYAPQHPYSAYTNPLEWDFIGITQDQSGWDAVEANFIRHIIRGPLYWMGLVDLGIADKKQTDPDVFRLTPVGAWLLAGAPIPDIPQSGGQIIVQPDFTITALDPVNDNTLYTLERFAQRLSAERAVMLRLTQQSVYAAQQQGWSTPRIQAYLEKTTGQPLPANVARSLQDWQEWHERITITPGLTLLFSADPDDLVELSQDSALNELLASQPAPGLAVLPANPPALRTKPGMKLPPPPVVQKIAALLIERDWVPVVLDRPGELPRAAVRLDSTGGLNLVHPPASLYLKAHLASLADPLPHGNFRLSREAVQRAVRSGMTAPEIILSLNQVLVETLPLEWEKRLTAWAGHFGSARLEPAAMLQFKDEQTFRELLDDPELARYMRAIRPAELRTTALVPAPDLEKLVRLLEERGVEIKRRS